MATMDSTLPQATALMESTRLVLESKGYSEGLVSAAIARARGSAQFKVKYVNDGIRGQAFLDTLRHELAHAETWLRSEQAGMEG